MDATKTFPLPTDSIDFIVSEHMIEHLELRGGRMMLSECRRVLRRRGVLRIATPDLERLIRGTYLQGGTDIIARDYITFMNKPNRDIPADDRSNPVYAINRIVRDWGHKFLYDERTLRLLLLEAGFTDVIRSPLGESHHPELVGVERHQEEVDVTVSKELSQALNDFQTMVLEAT